MDDYGALVAILGFTVLGVAFYLRGRCIDKWAGMFLVAGSVLALLYATVGGVWLRCTTLGVITMAPVVLAVNRIFKPKGG